METVPAMYREFGDLLPNRSFTKLGHQSGRDGIGMDDTQLRRDGLQVENISNCKAMHAAPVPKRRAVPSDVHKDPTMFAACLVHAAMRAQRAGALGFFVNPVELFIPRNQVLAGVAAVDATFFVHHF